MLQVTLKQAREACGYTVEDIAVICGLSVEDVRIYEHDTRKMPFDLVRKVKRLFHIDISQIYVGLESEYTIDSHPKRAQNVPKTCLGAQNKPKF